MPDAAEIWGGAMRIRPLLRHNAVPQQGQAGPANAAASFDACRSCLPAPEDESARRGCELVPQ